MSNDYGKTINLPKTELPMKANLPQREEEIERHWLENDIYGTLLKRNKGKPKFILHDGPPYANGDIHLGHALNKVLKDFIIRQKTMAGYDAPYVPGWDTHGLPTEHQVIKSLGVHRHEIEPLEWRRRCREFAAKFISKQREQFKRLGVRGDWDNPYITMDAAYEAEQIAVFKELVARDLIYKGLRPIYWCPSCETALAEAEIEYHDKTSNSIYVKFPYVGDRSALSTRLAEESTLEPYFIIWTTTPWTLISNVAVAVNPHMEYSVAVAGNSAYVVASELLEETMSICRIDDYSILDRVSGKDLECLKCRHPFFGRDSLLILSEFVTSEQGTGCVHTAPGHGPEDFAVASRYDLPVISPLDNRGIFTSEAGDFTGLRYDIANTAVMDLLAETGYLMAREDIKHSYPHCWRCKKPVVFRATEQWFVNVNEYRDAVLGEIGKVDWIPEWGMERIANMVKDRPDWCLSRQRIWGVPLPIFYCECCNRAIIEESLLNAVEELFAREGSDAWYKHTSEEIMPGGYSCPDCGGTKFRKETDIMDVWFDSGVSHRAVLAKRPELAWPADLYLEGSDQYRGWFQTSMLTSVGATGKAPYKQVLTHGFLVDEEGRKMSKSLGNVVEPQRIIKKYGADILRLWIASTDFRSDIRVSDKLIGHVVEVYRRIRNTARFMLGNLDGFNVKTDALPYEDLQEIDRWALMKLDRLCRRVTEAYEKYEFHTVYHSIHNFCAVDMSSFYLDVLKDRLYTSATKSLVRRSAQTVFDIILRNLTLLFSPVLPHTAEEIWGYAVPDAKSVELQAWPQPSGFYEDESLNERWERFLVIRKEVLKALENAKNAGIIGKSLEAAVSIDADDDTIAFLDTFGQGLREYFIVSHVSLKKAEGGYVFESLDKPGIYIGVSRAGGEKCARCWVYSEDVGTDAHYADLCNRCLEVVKNV